MTEGRLRLIAFFKYSPAQPAALQRGAATSGREDARNVARGLTKGVEDAGGRESYRSEKALRVDVDGDADA